MKINVIQWHTISKMTAYDYLENRPCHTQPWGGPGGWIYRQEPSYCLELWQIGCWLGCTGILMPQELAWHWGVPGAWDYQNWPGTGDRQEPRSVGVLNLGFMVQDWYWYWPVPQICICHLFTLTFFPQLGGGVTGTVLYCFSCSYFCVPSRFCNPSCEILSSWEDVYVHEQLFRLIDL